MEHEAPKQQPEKSSPDDKWIGRCSELEHKCVGLEAELSQVRQALSEYEAMIGLMPLPAFAIGPETTEHRETQRALAQSETVLLSTLESTADGILVVGADAHVLHYNGRFASMWRIPEEILFSNDDNRLIAHVLDQLVNPDAFLERTRALYGCSEEGDDILNFKDGRVFERHSAPLTLHGSLLGRVWSFRDVTSRLRSEAESRRWIERLSAIMDSLSALAYVVDSETRQVLYANKRVLDEWGPVEGGVCWQVLQRGQAGPCEFCLLGCSEPELGAPARARRWEFQSTLNGRWYDCVDQIIPWPDGRLVNLEVAMDVTERKTAADSLQKANALLEGVLDGITDIVGIQKPDHAMLRYNRAGYEALGLTEDQVVGRKCFELIGRTKACDNCATTAAIAQKTAAVRERYVPEIGRYLQCRSNPILDDQGQVALIVEQLEDITERTRSEQALRESEAKFRTLAENTRALIVLASEDHFLYANPRVSEVLGYSQEELLRARFIELVHPDDRETVKRNAIARRSADPPPTRYCVRVVAKSGETRWIELGLSTVSIDGLAVVVASGLDISERMRAEDALRESESKYRAVVENSKDAIMLLQDGVIRFSNARSLEASGFTKEELAGRRFIDHVHPEERALALQHHVERLEGKAVPSEHVFRLLRKDGIYRSVSVVAAVVEWDGRPATLCYLTDVTERLREEEERHHLQMRTAKLEGLRILAGGIAHDFNNLVSGILLNVRAATEVIERHDAKECLDDAAAGCIQAGALTRQLLTFAKGTTPNKGPVSIEQLVKDVTEFFLRGSNVAAVWDFRHSHPVEADAGQIAQVFQNLVMNAKQAMPSGGTLSISSHDLNDIAPPCVRVTVQDQGIGIPGDLVDKIFDPYFTTKSEGSGLGLAVVLAIVQKHGGRVSVESKVGVGSHFHIDLPASNKVETRPQVTTLPSIPKLRILVMDDQKMIRVALSRLLERDGHQVTAASDGEEAISCYTNARGTPEAFDAVILDLTIPGGLGGREAGERILAVDPKARVIVSSGYSTDSTMSCFEDLGFRGALQKPYEYEALIRILAKAVGL